MKTDFAIWLCVNLNLLLQISRLSPQQQDGNAVVSVRLNDEVVFFSFLFLRLTNRMGRKDASASALPVDQYRKQIGKSFGQQQTPIT